MPPSSSVWPVVVETVRPVSAGAMAWRCGDRWSLSVVVKATFALVEEGTAELIGPAPLVRHERFADAGSAPAFVEDTDLVPYRPQVDVTFSGAVHAAHPVQAIRARLAVVGPSEGFDKSIQAVGDRVGHAAPRPFRQMPIGWQRSWATSDNPAGVKPGGSHQANIIDPRSSDAATSLGPIPRSWPSRARLIAAIDPRPLDGGVPNIPQGFAWEYYQGSPRDQRLGRLEGSETIVLENLLEGRPRLRTRLPAPRGRARLYGPWAPAEGLMLDLAADALIIDGETQSLSIVWRASVPLSHGERSLDGVRVVTGVELPGFPMPWSGSSISGTHPAPQAPQSPQPHRPPSLSGLQAVGRAPVPLSQLPRAYEDDAAAEGTALLDTHARPGIQFAGAASLPSAAIGPAPAPTSNSTMALTPEEAMRLIASAPRHMPFPGSGLGVPPPPPPPPPPIGTPVPARHPAMTMPSRTDPNLPHARPQDSSMRAVQIGQPYPPPPTEERTRQIELKSVFATEETSSLEPNSAMTRPHQAPAPRSQAGFMSSGPPASTSASTMALTPEQAQAMIAAAAAQRGGPLPPPMFGAPQGPGPIAGSYPSQPAMPPSPQHQIPPPTTAAGHGGFPVPPRIAPPDMLKQDTLPSASAVGHGPPDSGEVDAAGATMALTPEQAQRMIEDANRRRR